MKFHKLIRMQHHTLRRIRRRTKEHHKLHRMRRCKLSMIQSENVETRTDFLQLLDNDVCAHIMSFLDDPVDIVRVSAVSRSWHQFVIANEIAKQACLKKIPGVTNIIGTRILDENRKEIDSDMNDEWEILQRDQKVYASLLQAIRKAKVDDPLVTMHYEVCASSTDKYPDRCILNTMCDVRTFYGGKPSYWSSKGQENPDVPETLIYKLCTGWVITDIRIDPFYDFSQSGDPIYSAKFVRFRVGHPKSPREFIRESRKYKYNWPSEESVDDKFVWSYVSPEFPMMQESGQQLFKLPEPVLCIDAYLQIEFLGRVQRNEKDGLYYICVTFVQVLGRPLWSAFNIKRTEPDKKLILRYTPTRINEVLESYYPSRTSFREIDFWFDKWYEVERRLEEMKKQQEPSDRYVLDTDEELDRDFYFFS